MPSGGAGRAPADAGVLGVRLQGVFPLYAHEYPDEESDADAEGDVRLAPALRKYVLLAAERD